MESNSDKPPPCLDPCELRMELCNESCSSRRLAILCGKTFHIGHYPQTFQPNLFNPALLLGTIDFYHYYTTFSFSNLDLAWGSQDQRKAKLLCFIFLHTCQLIKMKFDIVLKQLNLKLHILILIVLFNEISWKKRKITAISWLHKKCHSWHAFKCLWMDLVQSWCGDRNHRYYWTLYFDTTVVSLTLILIQGHRNAREQNLCQLFFSWFRQKLICCWNLVWWMWYSFYLVHLIFRGENPT